LILLSLCHSIIVEKQDNINIYNTPSPDELALANFAKFSGWIYDGLDIDNNMLIKTSEKELKFK